MFVIINPLSQDERTPDWGFQSQRFIQKSLHKSMSGPDSRGCPFIFPAIREHFARKGIRNHWNETEKISVAPTQGRHAQIEKCKQFPIREPFGAGFGNLQRETGTALQLVQRRADARKLPCILTGPPSLSAKVTFVPVVWNRAREMSDPLPRPQEKNNTNSAVVWNSAE